MNKITDNIFNIKEYLTNHELLTFSVVTDKNIKLDIDRKKVFIQICNVNNMFIFSEYFKETNNLIDDINSYINWICQFNLFNYSIYIIKDISYNFCKYRSFPTFDENYINNRNKFKKDKIFYTKDFNTRGKFLYNEYICSTYNCRLRGKVLRDIKRSLTLKALIN